MQNRDESLSKHDFFDGGALGPSLSLLPSNRVWGENRKRGNMHPQQQSAAFLLGKSQRYDGSLQLLLSENSHDARSRRQILRPARLG
jgi:hypothetical protein